jgi:hypothetical protein
MVTTHPKSDPRSRHTRDRQRRQQQPEAEQHFRHVTSPGRLNYGDERERGAYTGPHRNAPKAPAVRPHCHHVPRRATVAGDDHRRRALDAVTLGVRAGSLASWRLCLTVSAPDDYQSCRSHGVQTGQVP